MFKRLIQNLTWDYEFIARGRGILSREEMDLIVRGDRTKVKHADVIMKPVDATPSKDDMIDLKECSLIVDHVEQMVEWIDQLGRAEIV